MLRKVLLPALAVTLAWAVLDFIMHGVLLRTRYMAMPGFWRSTDDVKLGVMYFSIFISAIALAAVYHNFVRPKSCSIALLFGIWLGLGHGIAFGYGSYAMMSIPYAVAFTWFLASIVKGAVAGVIVGALVREPAA
ncbi:MAG: hypothetical protein AABZ94_08770 [Candidatus Eisenbacteria bacterium]